MGEAEPAKKFKRDTLTYENCSEHFQLHSRKHDSQFCQLYFNRLRLLQYNIRDAAENKWNSGNECTPISDKVIDLVEGKESVIFGTISKEMPLRPSVIQQYANDRTVKTLDRSKNYTSEKDSLVLEDNSGRIRLTGARLNVHKFVTGIVAAFKGQVKENGQFDVSDWCFVGIPVQPAINPLSSKRYMAFISGLDIGSSSKNSVAMQLLVEYLTGNLGSRDENEFQSSIVKLVIAGNALNSQQITEGVGKQVAGIREREVQQSLSHVRELDSFLFQLSSSIAVDIMPGEKDAANFSLPQQPIHRCVIPLSSKNPSLRSCTNPYQFEDEGINVFGTSGQTIDNLMMFGRFDSPLEAAELTLNWSHIAPTCPDSMSSYPYSTSDPFILKKCPRIYFIGNQDKFDTKVVTGPQGQETRIIAIPSFSQTGTLVLVDLQSFECETITFGFE